MSADHALEAVVPGDFPVADEPVREWQEVTAAKLTGAPVGLLQPGAIPRRNALRFPEKTAYVVAGQRVSWAEVDAATDALAHGFRRLGICAEDHVAVVGGNDLAFVQVEFALMKLGAVVVLVSPALSAAQLAVQLDHAAARAVVAVAGVRERLREVGHQLLADIIVTWGAETTGDPRVEDLLADGIGNGPFEMAAIRPGDAAVLLYTSGTTGIPKGAVNTYFDLTIKLLTNSLSAEYKEYETGLVLTPLCMAGTQVLSFLNYAMMGMTCVIASGFEPGAVLRTIAEERVSTMLAVPTMTTALVNHPLADSTDLSSFERLYSAGATLPVEIFQRVRKLGVRVCEIYGSSETGGGIVASSAEKDARPTSVGRPKVGHEVRVVDDDDRPVPRGSTGELVMRGDPVTAGYFEQPDIHRESFRNNWFHTGDVGYQDEDGYYYVIDRKKDMVVSGGTNVYPRDVEEILYGLPGVVEAAVVGLGHERWGEAVTAFVVRAPGAALTAEEVRSACRAKLAAFQVPKDVVFLDALPKTAMGKISKVALRSDYDDLYMRGEGS
ncbi:MAG: fatty-acyl-CoA synthase [Pseudonocardiales bacterium]|nr:fatty-acyl-CoA synthase [Pseudonocardiales bacterium]